MPSGRIIFNVGGTRFETTTDTINQYPTTFLSALLKNSTSTDTKCNEIFIDRDPTYFSTILNFYRNGGSIDVPITRAIQKELDFFQIGVAGDEMVILNIGGTLFYTSRKTIMKFPDALLAQHLTGKIDTLRDSNNNIFIDADPSCFDGILKFYRTMDMETVEQYGLGYFTRKHEEYKYNTTFTNNLIFYKLPNLFPKKDIYTIPPEFRFVGGH